MTHTNLNVESRSSQNSSYAGGRCQPMAREAQPTGDSGDEDARRLGKMAAERAKSSRSWADEICFKIRNKLGYSA